MLRATTTLLLMVSFCYCSPQNVIHTELSNAAEGEGDEGDDEEQAQGVPEDEEDEEQGNAEVRDINQKNLVVSRASVAIDAR